MYDRYLTIDEVDKYLEWEKNEYENQKWIEEKKQDKKPLQERINYHINNNQLGEGTPKQKVLRNIEAIKLLNKLENDSFIYET